MKPNPASKVTLLLRNIGRTAKELIPSCNKLDISATGLPQILMCSYFESCARFLFLPLYSKHSKSKSLYKSLTQAELSPPLHQCVHAIARFVPQCVWVNPAKVAESAFICGVMAAWPGLSTPLFFWFFSAARIIASICHHLSQISET